MSYLYYKHTIYVAHSMISDSDFILITNSDEFGLELGTRLILQLFHIETFDFF